MRKLFTLLLAVAASVGTMFAWDYERVQIGDLYYNLDATNQTAEVTSQNSSYPYWSTSITTANIPSSVEYNSVAYSVTSIGEEAFFKCSSLTSIEIPNGVTSIGEKAFYQCSGLTGDLIIPNSVTSIGEKAFLGCRGLTSMTIPNSVTSIGEKAFYQCSGLTAIDVAADNPNYCAEEGVLFSKDKTTLVAYPGGKQGAYSIPNSVTSIGSYAFYDCSGLTGNLIIPNSVTSIGNDAFNGCRGLTSVTIPNSVTSIGEKAFYDCRGLTSVTIPNSVTSIGSSAFYNCRGLTSVTIPNSVTSIGNNAFKNTGLTSVTIEAETPPTLGNNVLDGSNCNIYIPCGTLEIYQVAEGWSEYASQIKYVSLPYTIATQAENGNVTTTDVTTLTVCDPSVICTAIANYGYHFVLWSDSVTDNPRTFIVTQDTTFTAEFAKNTYTISTTSANPEWGTTVGGKSALYLDEVEISATANYGYHFTKWNDNNTSNPRTVSVTEDKTYTATFAKNVYSIATNAEHGSISGNSSAEYLDVVELIAEPNHGYHFVQWSDGNTDNPRTFIVTQDTTFTAIFAQTFSGPCGDNLYWEYADDKLKFTGSGDMYEYSNMDIPWSLFTQSVRSIDFAAGMNSISAYAYQGMTNIHKVNLPSSIETIGDYAFAGCTGIKALSIPNNVTSLGAGAFEGCYNIDSLIIGTGVTFITDQFLGCTGLRYLQLSQNMQEVGSGAFIDAERLNYIVCHAKYPPVAYADKGAQLRSFYNMNARVLVPCDNFEDYEADALWGSFNLKCLSSESGTAVDGQVTVIPGDADATFTWPTDGTAETYNLEITKEGVVFCTLTFNSQGQLLGIHFAPSRDGKPHQMPSANLTTNGMTFQVTGLDYASQYRFSFETKNATQTIFAYTGAFSTNGAQGVENVHVDSEIPTKVLIDGQIFILRGEKVYNAQGALVK